MTWLILTGDSDDLVYSNIEELPDIFTTFRKSLEPLRDRPRNLLPTPTSLPPFPTMTFLNQPHLSVPSTREGLLDALLRPLLEKPDISHEPTLAADDDVASLSAHPFEGGETHAHARLQHLLVSGAMAAYKETRNGLIGKDYSTKLSAYLAHGCITARQVHATMARFEDGDASTANSAVFDDDMLEEFKKSSGYGSGENEGTIAVRFELLWRDYMRLCADKFGAKLFSRTGFRDKVEKKWESIDGSSPAETQSKLQRFLSGRTGIGLVDASQRELYLSGYTGNRARQNVASFLAKHLYIDWRLGAEWYESMLVDYDAASNWGNWQYVAGVGNDPREGRIFNPIKQALDYDPKGEYIKAWIPELRNVQLNDAEGSFEQEKLMGLYQAWRLPEDEKLNLGLDKEEWVSSPLVTIEFSIGRKPKQNSRPGMRREAWGGRGGPSSGGRGGYRGGAMGGRGRGDSFRGGRGRGYGRGDYSTGAYRGNPYMAMSG
jgi:deoxyribodipyrimidine photo-lyase